MTMDWQTRLIENYPVGRVQALNLVLPLLFAALAALAASGAAATGVLIGGALVNLSFLALKKDLAGAFFGPPRLEKLRFLVKYYARVTALAVVLYYLVKVRHVHVFGLLIGLSSVAVSILCVTAVVAGRLYLSEREAL